MTAIAAGGAPLDKAKIVSLTSLACFQFPCNLSTRAGSRFLSSHSSQAASGI